jgi:hypothetical protein
MNTFLGTKREKQFTYFQFGAKGKLASRQLIEKAFCRFDILAILLGFNGVVKKASLSIRILYP